MSVRRINGWWWIDFRHERTRHRKKSPANTRGAALAYEARLRQRLAQGHDLVPKPPKPVLTLSAFAERWFATYVVANNKPSEQYNKRISFNAHLLPAMGSLPLDQITVARIEAHKAAELTRGLSPKSVNNQLAHLGKCLRAAHEWGELASVPRVKLLRVPQVQLTHLQPQESERLLASEPDPFWRTMILVALRTGLRHSELLALDWTDVDLTGRVLTVRRGLVCGIMTSPKSHKIRHVPITAEVCEALERWSTRAGLIFARDRGTCPLRRETTRQVLHRAFKTAGIPKSYRLGWHTLRHTFASQLATRGVPLHVVQALMGHSDIRTTMRYAHLSPSSLADAVATLTVSPQQPRPLGSASASEPRRGQPVGMKGRAVPLPSTPAAARALAIGLNKAKGRGRHPTLSLGSETWIRTMISGFRVRCPTIRRSRNNRLIQ